MGLISTLALCIHLAAQPGATPGCATFALEFQGDGGNGRVFVKGAPADVDRLLAGYPALIGSGEEIALRLNGTMELRSGVKLVAYQPGAPLTVGRRYTLKSWEDSQLVVTPRDAPRRLMTCGSVRYLGGATAPPRPAPLWQKLLGFVAAPFFLSYALTALAIRARRRRILREVLS